MAFNCVTISWLIPLILALIMQAYFIQSFFEAPANKKHCFQFSTLASLQTTSDHQSSEKFILHQDCANQLIFELFKSQ